MNLKTQKLTKLLDCVYKSMRININLFLSGNIDLLHYKTKKMYRQIKKLFLTKSSFCFDDVHHLVH